MASVVVTWPVSVVVTWPVSVVVTWLVLWSHGQCCGHMASVVVMWPVPFGDFHDVIHVPCVVDAFAFPIPHDELITCCTVHP